MITLAWILLGIMLLCFWLADRLKDSENELGIIPFLIALALIPIAATVGVVGIVIELLRLVTGG